MNKSFKLNFGFSLIEVVIGIAIIGVVGGVMAVILNRTYKGSNKTTLIGNLKQNGQTALNTIDSTLRQGEAIVCPQNSAISDTIVVQTKEEGKYIRFKFSLQPSDKSRNGTIEQETLMLINPTQVQGLCSVPAASPVKLTDDREQSGVSVTKGGFTVLKNRGVKDVVTIEFDLGPPIGTGISFDQIIQNNINFKTSVQLR